MSSAASQTDSPLHKPIGKLATLPTIAKSVTCEAVEPAVMQRDKESWRHQMASFRGSSHSKDTLRRADREDHLDALHQILRCPKDLWHMPDDIKSLRQLSQVPSPSDTPSSLRRTKYSSFPISFVFVSGRREA
jgi:hypothetical protein